MSGVGGVGGGGVKRMSFLDTLLLCLRVYTYGYLLLNPIESFGPRRADDEENPPTPATPHPIVQPEGPLLCGRNSLLG